MYINMNYTEANIPNRLINIKSFQNNILLKLRYMLENNAYTSLRYIWKYNKKRLHCHKIKCNVYLLIISNSLLYHTRLILYFIL